MQNEFEKQVKQKMGELDFVPSAPVWQKIEEQIRQKKERKRLAFWLPLALLLVGGGITWYILQNDQPDSVAIEKNTIEEKSTHQLSENKKQVTQGTQEANTFRGESPNSIHSGSQATSLSGDPVSDKDLQPVIDKLKITDRRQLKEFTQTNAVDLSGNADNKIVNHQSVIGTEKQNNETGDGLSIYNDVLNRRENKISGRSFGTIAIPVRTDASKMISYPAITVNEQSSVIPLMSKGIIDSNAVVAVQIPKTFGRSAWRFGVEVNAGLSGSNNGLPALQVLNKSSSDYFSLPDATPPPPASLYNRNVKPSEATGGYSFGAGMVARKQLNKRFAFQTGLQYLYMSTKMKVGVKTSGNALNNSSGYQYAFTPALLNDYTNSYHFISLPALIEYQLLKRKPLQVHAGISLHHLAFTNALHFDNVSKLYVKDKNKLNTNQVFSELGLSYSVPIKKMTLTAGPHLRYSLEELENEGRNNHLVSVGLKAVLLLQKK